MNICHTPADYQPSSNALQNKVIVVTGAGRGIGRAAALSYAAHGATVVLLGRKVEQLEQVYDEIEAAGGAQPAIFPADLSELSDDNCRELATALENEFGVLHGLLHNAGILGERTPIENATSKAFVEVMQVNVNAAFMLTRHLLPLLQQADRASVVFTSSSVGRQGRAFWGAYAVSKFATEGLMQVLADELENIAQVRVNSLNPGATRTDMRATAYPAENPATLVAPEDIMACYLYLMDDASAQINGQAFDAQRK